MKLLLLIILVCILFYLIYIHNKNIEFFNNNLLFDLSDQKLDKYHLISRIRTLNYYKNKPKCKCILVSDFKNYIDNQLSKDNLDKLIIIDHPYKSCCQSTFNYQNFLSKSNIKVIYAENWKDNVHPKLNIIPIGFESKAITKNNNETLMLKIAKKQKKLINKPLKILNNTHFLIHKKPKSGSYNQRQEVIDKLKNNQIVDFWDKKRTKEETWKEHDNYSFEICGEGNGLDTHRFYEALLFNTIPIVKRNSLESMYLKFPCVILDDWNEITKENCIKWKRELQDRIENEKYKLELDFWFNK